MSLQGEDKSDFETDSTGGVMERRKPRLLVITLRALFNRLDAEALTMVVWMLLENGYYRGLIGVCLG